MFCWNLGRRSRISNRRKEKASGTSGNRNERSESPEFEHSSPGRIKAPFRRAEQSGEHKEDDRISETAGKRRADK